MDDETDWIHEGPDLAALGYKGDYGWLNTVLTDALNRVSRGMTMVGFLFVNSARIPAKDSG